MQLYREAGRICQLVSDKRGSAKNLVFASSFENKKQLFALVAETIKYDHVLKQILESSKLLKRERSIKDEHLAKCLIYDFLIGKGLRGAGNFMEVVSRHSAALKSELARIKVKAKVANNKDLLTETSESSVKIPRYVRVNTLRSSVQDVVQQFKQERYQLVTSSRLDYDRYLDAVRTLKEKQFIVDMHIPELLVFPPGADLHEHPLYLSGDIILQDKASCLPAIVLDPPAGRFIIDCCAAPGNKTTHLAALIKNKGKVFAFDKDAKRLSTLNTLVLRAGASCVVAAHGDFLLVDPHDVRYAAVEYILVDPSCSGSGIANRLKRAGDEADDVSTMDRRLKSLSAFQTSILKHAMSFPKARRVVYSTCSVHDEENELVVKTVVEAHADSWSLTSALPAFPIRGNIAAFPDGAERCVRLSPEDSLTNGFFVACFERDLDKEKNKAGMDGCPNPVETVFTKNGGSKENTIIEKSLVLNSVALSGKRKKRKAKEVTEEISKKLICSEKDIKIRNTESGIGKTLHDGSLETKMEGRESEDACESLDTSKHVERNSPDEDDDLVHRGQDQDEATNTVNCEKNSPLLPTLAIDNRKNESNRKGNTKLGKKCNRRKRNHKPVTIGGVTGAVQEK